jgi:hypothetical protein
VGADSAPVPATLAPRVMQPLIAWPDHATTGATSSRGTNRLTDRATRLMSAKLKSRSLTPLRSAQGGRPPTTEELQLQQAQQEIEKQRELRRQVS